MRVCGIILGMRICPPHSVGSSGHSNNPTKAVWPGALVVQHIMGNVPYSSECEASSEKQDDHHLSEERMLAAGASGVPGRVRKSTLHVCYQ